VLVTEQLHIGPKRTTKEPIVFDIYGIVFQDIDIGAFCLFLKLIDKPRKLFLVKLVVAQNVENGGLKFLVKYPLKPAIFDMDIAGQHNKVGVDSWWHKIVKLNMEITQDMYFQNRPPPTKSV
jgi:hypothetical protein